MIEHKADCLLELPCQLGEGPVWDPAGKQLYWVDIQGNTLHSWSPSLRKHLDWKFGEPVCAVSPEAEGGRLLVAFAKRLALFDPATSQLTPLVEMEPECPKNRCNDGKCDPAGRFWIGTMSTQGEKHAGALYRWDPTTGHLDRILDRLTISNGLGWSGDHQTMFFVDSPEREVWAFDFDSTSSSIANRRTVVRVPPDLGVPDGLCVAGDDTLWVAHWGAGCVCRWDPSSGALLEKVTTGCPHTTSCTLAPDGLLYITTARAGLGPEALAAAPLSGSLFVHPTR